MFWKKKQINLANQISDLEKRICNLENPYKFNIGDYVSSKCYSFSENSQTINFGTIVSQNHEYKDENYQLRGIIRLSTFVYDIVYKRYNLYQVYHESENKTITYSESELQLKSKKK
jgi:hypothetical protein